MEIAVNKSWLNVVDQYALLFTDIIPCFGLNYFLYKFDYTNHGIIRVSRPCAFPADSQQEGSHDMKREHLKSIHVDMQVNQYA